MKNNKGITLIALIITIIVLLILVAVTITVALEGGLFKNANEAAKKTEPQAIYETIVSAMILTDNGDINVKQTAEGAQTVLNNDDKQTEIEPNPLLDNTEEAILTVQGKTGTYKYKITGSAILFYNGEGGGKKPEPISYETYYNISQIFTDQTDLLTCIPSTADKNDMYILAFEAENGKISQFMFSKDENTIEATYFPKNDGSEGIYNYNWTDKIWKSQDSDNTLNNVSLTKVKILSKETIDGAGVAQNMPLYGFTDEQVDTLISRTVWKAGN